MVSLPPGFDASLLMTDFFTAAIPFFGLAFLVATGLLFVRILRRA